LHLFVGHVGLAFAVFNWSFLSVKMSLNYTPFEGRFERRLSVSERSNVLTQGRKGARTQWEKAISFQHSAKEKT
jgi:hypothetical protein